ncbi:MAG: DUF3418 domain-containing protein, partial [Burkholderiales bacterium]
ETSRLYARTVAAIEPQWLEDLGAHLIKRQCERPHWEKTRAQVVALERGTLYGLPVYANRRIHYGPLDPELAHGIFIRSALVEGEFDTQAPFFTHNRKLLHEIERLEHKSRRPDILVDDALIEAFYDARIPQGIHNGADFERWRKEAERAEPNRLFLRREDLMRHEASGITTENFPPRLQLGLNGFELDYSFEPGSARDGVTLTVPVAVLNQVPAARCEWLVPGLLKEKVRLLARSLPQRLRNKLGSLEAFAGNFVAAQAPSDLPLATALARHIRAELNLEVPLDAMRPDSVPPHLQMNFLAIDEHGRQLAMGRNLADLKRELGVHTRAVLQEEAPAEDNERYREWAFGDLEEIMELRRGDQTLLGYPAIVDAGEAVTLQVFDAPERAAEVHRAGVRRLLAIAFRERIREIEKSVVRDNTLNLQFAQLAGDIGLADEVVSAALERSFLADALPMRQADFNLRVDEGRSRLSLIAQEITRTVSAILGDHAQVQKGLAATAKDFPQATLDVSASLSRLLHPRFVSRTPWPRLKHFPRYLKASVLRLNKLRTDPDRDARLMAEFAPLGAAWQREYAAREKAAALTPEIEQFRWLLEELRVSLFAQSLKTPVPVSVKRLAKLWQSIRHARP